MGIAVSELLTMEYFKEFYVLAGKNGLHKEIQGTTLLEAPDALNWSKGKELILSSGYVLKQEPDCLAKAFREGSIQGCSAMMIKRDRHLKIIPEELLALFDQYDIPLISMPFSIPWMELMSQINTAVMNRTIERFRIGSVRVSQISSQSYKERKIQKILQAVETEMKFPAFLYDLTEDKSYYSSSNFEHITKKYELQESDYWNPSRPYNKYTLCDFINMYRIRLINPGHAEGPRVSWITIPIAIEGIVQAYFVVMESREFIDYFDEYSIRIAFLSLQGVYEQIVVANSVGHVGFENFIFYLLNNEEHDVKKIYYQATIQGLSVNTPFTCVLFKQIREEYHARNERDIFLEAFQNCGLSVSGRMAFLDENEGILVLESQKYNDLARSSDIRHKHLSAFADYVESKCKGMQLEFALSGDESPLLKLRDSIAKCRKIMHMGQILIPDRKIREYGMLGPLTWLDIPEAEETLLLESYRELAENEKNTKLLRTLKVYLENRMNFSITAEKMYVHINTIRKRIEKIDSMIDIDWDDPISRLKAELLLNLLGF